MNNPREKESFFNFSRKVTTLFVPTSLLLIFFISFSFGQYASKEYVISPNDILEITVYGEADFSTTVRVAADGTISYPYLGNIRVAGLTIRQLEAHITELLGEDYLVNPQVNIFVKEYTKISVMGEVRNPGSYEMKNIFTLMQAIAAAGGFSETADRSKVKIIRSLSSGQKILEINTDKIINREIPDVEVYGGDTVVVEQYGRFSIMGQVSRPGVYPLRRGMTVIEAISVAGGFTPTAAQSGTRLIRMEDGQKKVYKIPVPQIMREGDSSKDMQLLPGDTIVVPESFF